MKEYFYSVSQKHKSLKIQAFNHTCIDCQTLYKEIYEEIKDLQDYQGITEQELSTYQTQIFFYSILLQGAKESSTPLYFGESEDQDSTNSTQSPSSTSSSSTSSSSTSSSTTSTSFKPHTPIYVLLGENEESQTLKVFLDSFSLTLYHYSLSESSLGIKLECQTQESQTKANKEKEKLEKQKQEKEALLSTPSLSAFTPIIEDDVLLCPHGGQVKLQSQKGKVFKSKGVPLILESDLANASISGCSNPPMSGGPCTQVALIPPLALSLKKFNAQGTPLQEYASMIMTDKGVPLMCVPKPNVFKVFQPANPQSKNSDASSKETQIQLQKPSLRLHFKSNPYQNDNLPIYRLFIQGEEKSQEEPFDLLELPLQECSTPLLQTLQQNYTKHEFKESQIQLGSNLLQLVFIIPTKLPKMFKKALEEYEDKDYGAGRFKLLESYSQDKLEGEQITNLRVFLSPAKLQKIDLEFALGLDSLLQPSQCAFKILEGSFDHA